MTVHWLKITSQSLFWQFFKKCSEKNKEICYYSLSFIYDFQHNILFKKSSKLAKASENILIVP